MLIKELRRRLLIIGGSSLGVLLLLLLRRQELVYVVSNLVGNDLIERSVTGSIVVLLGLSGVLGVLFSIPVLWINFYLFICCGLVRLEQGKVLVYMLVSLLLLGISFVGFGWFYGEIVSVLYRFRVNELIGLTNIGIIEDHYVFLIQAVLLIVIVGQLPLLMELVLVIRLLTTVRLLYLRRYFILLSVLVFNIVGSWCVIVLWLMIYEVSYIRRRVGEIKV